VIKMGRQLRSDALKLKRTPFYILHMAIPVMGVLVFISYMGISAHAPESLTVNYLQVLALVYPILATWLCSVVIGQEIEAGGGFFMLTASLRRRALLSKLFFLLGFGLAACLLVIFGYGRLAPLVRKGYLPSGQMLLVSALIVWGCAIFLYLFHVWLCLRFGRNVSFAMSAVELLFSALMLTGLGETVWFLVPSAWGVRLVSLYARYASRQVVTTVLSISSIISIIALTTLGMLVLILAWLCRWEGRKSYDD